MSFIGCFAVGKTTVKESLAKNHGFHNVISFTTRNIRPGEENGVSYDFIKHNEKNLRKLFNKAKNGELANLNVHETDKIYGTMSDQYISSRCALDVTSSSFTNIKSYSPRLIRLQLSSNHQSGKVELRIAPALTVLSDLNELTKLLLVLIGAWMATMVHYLLTTRVRLKIQQCQLWKY